MKSKDWKKLWDFAEKQNIFLEFLDILGKNCYKECFAIGGIVFCKDGSIRCYNCDKVLIGNLTSKQMKSIIKNLMEVLI